MCILTTFQVSVACQTINVYDLRYSENPFECPEMLIGLGVGIAVLALIAIAAICCYACGKYRSQRTEKYYPNRQNKNTSLKFGKTSRKDHAHRWVNLSNTFRVQGCSIWEGVNSSQY